MASPALPAAFECMFDGVRSDGGRCGETVRRGRQERDGSGWCLTEPCGPGFVVVSDSWGILPGSHLSDARDRSVRPCPHPSSLITGLPVSKGQIRHCCLGVGWAVPSRTLIRARNGVHGPSYDSCPLELAPIAGVAKRQLRSVAARAPILWFGSATAEPTRCAVELHSALATQYNCVPRSLHMA